jgi:hypothetical protein
LHAVQETGQSSEDDNASQEDTLLLRIALLLALSLGANLTFARFASAQQPPAGPTAKPLPSDADLDTLVTTRNWSELSAVLAPTRQQDEFFRKLRWLRGQVNTGGGLLLTLAYVQTLWTLSSVASDSERATLRQDAAWTTLYAFELVVIDGAKCEDRSSPGHHVQQLRAQLASILEFTRRQPAVVRLDIVDRAIAFEEQTAPIRDDDEMICRGGLAETIAGLERGQQTPSRLDVLPGKNITVAPPPGWRPKFVAPDVYGPMQETARAGMRESLLKFVSPPS